ncbi:MAG: hypothetical protein K0R00_3401 [Herbinix sp.]|jgi:hypothetical protein|nr:hypothetical protein [Herbinix sp.]
MKKRIILPILVILIFLIVATFIWFIMKNSGNKIVLYDYRFASSDQYNINSKSDRSELDKIISQMNPIEDNDSNEIKVGGVIIIEMYHDDLIESYRIQGTNVTKNVYRESYDDLLSISKYKLDDKYYQDLSELSDKLKSKT